MESNSVTAIKKNSDFVEIKNNGKRYWPSKWMLLNYKLKSETQIRYGVTVSRKVGSAITRNKLKRWSREYFRALAKTETPFGADINVIFKPIDKDFYKKISHDEFHKSLEKGILFVFKNKQ